MDFDEILPDVGSFGLYQKLVICVILLPAVLPCAFHAYSQLFIAARPAHWCRAPQLEPYVHEFPDIVKNLSVPRLFADGEYQYSECQMYLHNYSELLKDVHSPFDFFTKFQNQSVIDEVVPIRGCLYGWNYDKSVFTSTVVQEFNLVCDKDFYATVALVVFGVGGLVGNYAFGYLQDMWGRKPSFYVYLIIEIAGCTLSAFAWNFGSWITMRFIVGLTVPAILASPYVLAIELVGPERRVFCTIITNIGYSLGLVMLSGIVYIFRDWRILSLAVALPLLLLFICFFQMPESPRWLIATGKHKRAAVVMRTMAKYNGKRLPHNYEQILKDKLLPLTPNSEHVEQNFNYGVRDLFATKNMCRKTIIITFIWFANTSVYVGLSYYAPALGGDELWNFFLAGAVELPTYLILWPGLQFCGRRWILCSSMVVGGIACLCTFMVKSENTLMLVLYCIGKMGISSAFVVLPLSASELYPTVVRGLGMSVSSVIGMIGPIIIPVINYMGSEMMVLPLIIMGALLTLGGVASLFLPETKDKSLPQTLQDGEKIPLVNPFAWMSQRRRQHNRNRTVHYSICSVCKTEIEHSGSKKCVQ